MGYKEDEREEGGTSIEKPFSLWIWTVHFTGLALAHLGPVEGRRLACSGQEGASL